LEPGAVPQAGMRSRRWRWARTGFQPLGWLGIGTWGVAPGWYEDAPLALTGTWGAAPGWYEDGRLALTGTWGAAPGWYEDGRLALIEASTTRPGAFWSRPWCIKVPSRNNLHKLTGPFGGRRRCSSVEDPRGIFSFVAPCQPPKSRRHLVKLIS
jgi:hypothetical protein